MKLTAYDLIGGKPGTVADSEEVTGVTSPRIPDPPEDGKSVPRNS